MRRAGSYCLDEFPLPVVIARFGPDIALPDLLVELATCERRDVFSRPCGARYTDLALRT